MPNINLKAMKNIDLMTVDPAILNDIQNVSIDVFKTPLERKIQYITQLGNPYYCKCDDTVIKLGNIKTDRTINDEFNSFVSDI